jgi:Uma2 family endonuclease
MTLRTSVHAIVAHAPKNPEPTPMAVPLTEPWTLEQLDRLPDDSNRYELVGGELLVTPPPSEAHETIVARLNALLVPFVIANNLGLVYHPRSVVQVGGERAEPDLMVRPESPHTGWANAPIPILVVEVLSRSTRERDPGTKRHFYMKVGVAEYWVVDREAAVVRQFRGGEEQRVATTLTWAPPGTRATLEIDVRTIFA